MRGQRVGHTLQTTALVNEAYVRLVDSSRVNWQDRSHFFAISAQLMRRILVDIARLKNSLMRGGERVLVSLADDVKAAPQKENDVVALDEDRAADQRYLVARFIVKAGGPSPPDMWGSLGAPWVV